MKVVPLWAYVHACKRLKGIGLNRWQRKEVLKELEHWEEMMSICGVQRKKLC